MNLFEPRVSINGKEYHAPKTGCIRSAQKAEEIRTGIDSEGSSAIKVREREKKKEKSNSVQLATSLRFQSNVRTVVVS